MAPTSSTRSTSSVRSTSGTRSNSTRSTSTRSSSVKRSRAIEEMKSKSHNNNNKRRLSLPSTIDSVTVANQSKAQRRLSGRLHARRRNSFGSNVNYYQSDDENADPVQLPTPYAQVVEERGGVMSPPQTRSAKKKKQRRFPPPYQHRDDNGDARPPLAAQPKGLLVFSPPDQAENERRERAALAKQEAERSRRVQSARESGQLQVFSPNGRAVYPANRRYLDEKVQRPTPSSEKKPAAKDSSSPVTTPERSSRRSSISSTRSPTTAPAPSSSVTKKALGVQRRQLQEESRTLQETNTKLEKKSQQLQKNLDNVNKELVSQKESHQAETSDLKSQLDSVHKQVESRVTGLEVVRSKLERQVAQLQTEKADLTTKTAALELRAVQLQDALTQNKNTAESMNRENEAEKEELALGLERLEQDNAGLRQQLDAVTQIKTAMETKITEYERLIENLQQHLLPEKESQLEKALVQLRVKEQAVVELESKITNYAELVQELRMEMQRILGQHDESKQSMSNALDEKSRENGDLQATVSEKDVKIQELVQQLEQVQGHLQEAQSSATAARDELDRRCAALEGRVQELNEALEATMSDLDKSERSAKECKRQLDDVQGQLEQALAEKDGAHSQNSQTHAAMNSLEQELSQAQLREKAELEAKQQLEERIKALEQERDVALSKRQEVEQNLAYVTNECQVLEKERDDARHHLAGFDDREAELTRRLQKSDQVRRDLHASVMQLMGNIRVFVRVRPTLEGEVEKDQKKQHDKLAATLKNASPALTKKRKRELEHADDILFRFPGLYDREEKQATKSSSSSSGTTAVSRAAGSEDILKNIIEVTEPWKDRGGLSQRRTKHRFGFDNVFSPNHGQEDVWEATEPLIQSAIDGFNVTLFAFGQTGSGKTYTMLGGEPDSNEEGVIVRSVRKLFQAKEEMEDVSKGETKVEVSVELLEIYNEQVRDLLAKNSGQGVALKVTSQEVVGNKVVATSTKDDVMRVLSFAQKRRSVKATASNAESSRSHMLFTIHFEVTTKDGMKRAGKLHVCDLAGSERLSKSGAHVVGGSLFEETKHINQSLSVLSNVIEKLQAGNEKPPFRESQLTYLLQNSLGGNSKTLAIICCSPLQSNYHETLCSLRFAEKVNKVSLKKACANLSC